MIAFTGSTVNVILRSVIFLMSSIYIYLETVCCKREYIYEPKNFSRVNRVTPQLQYQEQILLERYKSGCTV